jgi:hypothetical protein
MYKLYPFKSIEIPLFFHLHVNDCKPVHTIE